MLLVGRVGLVAGHQRHERVAVEIGVAAAGHVLQARLQAGPGLFDLAVFACQPRDDGLDLLTFVFAEGDGRVTIFEEEGRVPLTTWAWNSERGCIELPSRRVKSRSSRLLVRIETTRAPLSLDRVVVTMR